MITAKAWVAAREYEGGGAQVTLHRLAQAQAALDNGITLNELLSARVSRYAKPVNAIINNSAHQLDAETPAREDTDEGAKFGDIAVREPIGADYHLTPARSVHAELMRVIAVCSDKPLAEIEALPFQEYIPMESWLGELVGLDGTE